MNERTPFAADVPPTPLAPLGRKFRRGNYRIIDEGHLDPNQPQPAPPATIVMKDEHGRISVQEGTLITPELRRARLLHEKQKRRAADPPPPAPQPRNRRNRPNAKPRLPDHLFNGEVPEIYAGRTAVCFATGPSLTDEVVDLIEPYHADGSVVCFGCNDAFRIVPYLDVSYACDPPWIQHAVKHYDWLGHPSVKWTQDKDMAPKYGLNWINGTSAPGLSTNRTLIHFGSNSGYQVLNLALLYGCQRFVLVGYNMNAHGGAKHFFGEHPQPMARGTSFPTFIQHFATIGPPWRERIINCTEHSSLDCFVKADLKETLKQCRASWIASRSHTSGPESPLSSSEQAPALPSETSSSAEPHD